MVARIPDAHVVNDDDEAIMRAAQHDRSAFTPIYQRYVDPIFRFCYHRLGNRAAAEDATSRVFERALTALPRYTSGSVRAWLFTIARNTVTDLYRQSRPISSLGGPLDVQDRGPGPEEVAVREDEATWLRSFMAQLNPDQRAVIELRLAGLTNDEIAGVLGKNRGNVRTITYRAMLKLRSLIEAEQAKTVEETFDAT